MTNKPMLSVERELLENHLSLLGRAGLMFTGVVGLLDSIDELRALLDAQHVVCSNGILCQNSKCAECCGNGAYKPVPFPGYPPVPEDRKLPADQHQGEPVAYMAKRKTPTGNARLDRPLLSLVGEDGWGPAFECIPLYAEQPAPVAVVHAIKSIMEAVEASKVYTVLTSDQCHALAQALSGVKP